MQHLIRNVTLLLSTLEPTLQIDGSVLLLCITERLLSVVLNHHDKDILQASAVILYLAGDGSNVPWLDCKTQRIDLCLWLCNLQGISNIVHWHRRLPELVSDPYRDYQ